MVREEEPRRGIKMVEEYCYGIVSSVEISQLLNRLGELGWEFVQVLPAMEYLELGRGTHYEKIRARRVDRRRSAATVGPGAGPQGEAGGGGGEPRPGRGKKGLPPELRRLRSLLVGGLAAMAALWAPVESPRGEDCPMNGDQMSQGPTDSSMIRSMAA
jgi:hypothetical protein